jgi:uncharacterized membrane protein
MIRFARRYGMFRSYALAGAVMMGLSLTIGSARADLKLCNNTDSRVGVAIGYKDKKGWASEGWWTAQPNKCLTLLGGDLIARYYYVFAIDYEKGGNWGGKSMLCIKDKVFTIRGLNSCNETGTKKVGFFEVDTAEQKDWTVNLTGDNRTPSSSN